MRKGVRPDAACNAMKKFRASTLSYKKTYSKIMVKSSLDKKRVKVYTCRDKHKATKICRAIKRGSKTTVKVNCAGSTWAVGYCGRGVELNVALGRNGHICQCQHQGFTLRPCIGNPNWGG